MLEMRVAEAEEDLFLYNVYSSTRLDEVSAWGWGEHERDAFLKMQWMMQRKHYDMQYPDADNLIVCYQGIKTGRMMLKRTPDMLHLIDISLLPAFRNRGIGTRLIQMLQQEALWMKQTIQLHVVPHNPARRLYERLGFQLGESTDMYWRMVWLPVNVIDHGEGNFK
jgi:ribosomal protein S18 acetylase RimI-like enzyme